MKGYLVLENGEVFEGERFGAFKNTICEVVYNTSMTGYTEIFTDPSYAGQAIVMTYPLIGNYGVAQEDLESTRIWAKAIIVHELAKYENNFKVTKNLDSFLKENGVPGLTGIDTRRLAKILKDQGTMRGAIVSDIIGFEEELKEQIKKYTTGNLAQVVTSGSAVNYGSTKPKQVALLDLGSKDNIINSLLKRGVGVTVYPATTPYEQILARRPDGIVITNGPGNPRNCENQIKTIKKLYKTNIPILGIGLGHELIAISVGFKTSKLKSGHRGTNYPVRDLTSGKIYITSQNNGYHVDRYSVNREVAEITFEDLTDGIIQGLKYKNKNVFTVGFSPEACPGPEEANFVFDEFIENVYKGGAN